MSKHGKFISDWRGAFEQISVWFEALNERPCEWTKVDWERLADLYRVSNISDANDFDTLCGELKKEGCVRDKTLLIRIGNWKAYGRIKDTIQCSEKNEKVAEITRQVFKTIRDNHSVDSSVAAIKSLHRELDGIGIPMASTLLAMYDPDNFAVIDRWAFSTLFPEQKGAIEIASYKQWRKYMGKILSMRQKTGLRCRDIDASLWFVSRMKR
jgi:hypothetical protein